MKLEAFSRLHRLPLEFVKVEILSNVNLAKYRKHRRIRTVHWNACLRSTFLCQSVIVQEIFSRGSFARGTLLPCEGKTRKEARNHLLKKIRGNIILLGTDMDIKIRVPKNLT